MSWDFATVHRLANQLWQQVRPRDPASSGVLQLITPELGKGQPAVVRMALGGATLLGLVAAGVLAVSAAALLLAAIGAIYFLVTQVLGIKIDFDPAAFAAEAQRASQGMAN